MFVKFSKASIIDHSAKRRTRTAKVATDSKKCGSFEYTPNTDGKYLYAAVRACTADVPNLNFDMLPHEELKTAYKSFVGASIFLNHDNTDPEKARGVILDAIYHDEDENDRWIECLMEFDEERCPKLCSLLRSGEIDTFSMGCFVPGTKITLGDGTTKVIENIQVGDMVLTHEGNVKPVIATMVHKHDGIVYEVSSYAQPTPMRLTEEHPVWVRRPARAAHDTVRGRIERNKGEQRHTCLCGRDFSTASSLSAHLREVERWGHDGEHGRPPEFEGWVEAKDIEIGDYVLDPTVVGVDGGDIAFARLLGYYLAEGNFGYDKNRNLPDGAPTFVEWNFHENEVEYHQEVMELIEALGYKPVGPYFKNTCATIRCNSPELAALMLEHGGKYSWGKKISQEVMRWGVEAQYQLLEAYLNGDGYYGGAHQRDEHFSFATASKDLAEQIFTICVRCGVRCTEPACRDYSDCTKDSIKNGGTVERRPCYTAQGVLGEIDSRSKKLAYVDENGLWRRVTKIRMLEYSGDVYNFEVADDNSYVAEGCAVHNCSVQSTTCSVCGNEAEYPYEFCTHVQQKGREFNGKLAYEICNGIEFFELSVVYDPADTTAHTREIAAGKKKVAGKMAAGGSLTLNQAESTSTYDVYTKELGGGWYAEIVDYRGGDDYVPRFVCMVFDQLGEEQYSSSAATLEDAERFADEYMSTVDRVGNKTAMNPDIPMFPEFAPHTNFSNAWVSAIDDSRFFTVFKESVRGDWNAKLTDLNTGREETISQYERGKEEAIMACHDWMSRNAKTAASDWELASDGKWEKEYTDFYGWAFATIEEVGGKYEADIMGRSGDGYTDIFDTLEEAKAFCDEESDYVARNFYGKMASDIQMYDIVTIKPEWLAPYESPETEYVVMSIPNDWGQLYMQPLNLNWELNPFGHQEPANVDQLIPTGRKADPNMKIGGKTASKDLTIAECDGIRTCEYDYKIGGYLSHSPAVFDPVSGYGCPEEGGYFEEIGCWVSLYLNGAHIYDVWYEGGDEYGSRSELENFFEGACKEIKEDWEIYIGEIIADPDGWGFAHNDRVAKALYSLLEDGRYTMGEWVIGLPSGEYVYAKKGKKMSRKKKAEVMTVVDEYGDVENYYRYEDLDYSAQQSAYDEWYQYWEIDSSDEVDAFETFFSSVDATVKDYRLDGLAGPSYISVVMDYDHLGILFNEGTVPDGESNGFWLGEDLVQEWRKEYLPELKDLADKINDLNHQEKYDEAEALVDEMYTVYENSLDDMAEYAASAISTDREYQVSEEAFADYCDANDIWFTEDGEITDLPANAVNQPSLFAKKARVGWEALPGMAFESWTKEYESGWEGSVWECEYDGIKTYAWSLHDTGGSVTVAKSNEYSFLHADAAQMLCDQAWEEWRNHPDYYKRFAKKAAFDVSSVGVRADGDSYYITDYLANELGGDVADVFDYDSIAVIATTNNTWWWERFDEDYLKSFGFSQRTLDDVATIVDEYMKSNGFVNPFDAFASKKAQALSGSWNWEMTDLMMGNWGYKRDYGNGIVAIVEPDEYANDDYYAPDYTNTYFRDEYYGEWSWWLYDGGDIVEQNWGKATADWAMDDADEAATEYLADDKMAKKAQATDWRYVNVNGGIYTRDYDDGSYSTCWEVTPGVWEWEYREVTNTYTGFGHAGRADSLEAALDAADEAAAKYVKVAADAYTTTDRAPEEISTIEDDMDCPLCGSENFDGEYCDVCGYQEPPEGFDDITIEHEDETEEELDQNEEEVSAEFEKEGSVKTLADVIREAANERMFDISSSPDKFIRLAASFDHEVIGFDTLATSSNKLQSILKKEGAVEL